MLTRISKWFLTVLGVLSIGTLAAHAAPPIGEQPTEQPPTNQQCIELASAEIAMTPNLPISIPGFPVTIRTNATILIHCGNHIRRKPVSTFAWVVQDPNGRPIAASGTSTSQISFAPGIVGVHKVTVTACPGCREMLITDFTSTNKPKKELVDVGGVKTLDIEVSREAQLPPLYTPPKLPSPLQSDNPPVRVPETKPGLTQYELSRSACPRTNAQWLTTENFPTGSPIYTLAEGRVYHTRVSRKDLFLNHNPNSNDLFAKLELDPHYQHLLVADTPEDRNSLLPFGGLEVEWESKEFPEAFRPIQGDRMSALGFLIIDCGHEKYTEIHPPIAVAVHRPRAVRIPEKVSFEEGQPPQFIGTNVITPGIVTDIWVNLAGGEALDCKDRSLSTPVPKLVQVLPSPNPPTPVFPCVPQPTTNGTRFQFHIYLPTSPATRMALQHLPPIAKPALFINPKVHPEAALLNANAKLEIREIERHLDVAAPYIKMEIDLSSLLTGERFAGRIEAAWVYPDATGANFGLKTLQAQLNELRVDNDGDSIGDGDWEFWAGIPSLSIPWTRLIDCSGCVEEKTYKPGDSVFRRFSINNATGVFGGEIFLFKDQLGSIAFMGVDHDLASSDDTGNILRSFIGAGSDGAASECDDQTIDNELDPTNSGCGAYTAKWTFVPGISPVNATLSPAGKEFASRLFVRGSDHSNITIPFESELFRLDTMSPSNKKTVVTGGGETEEWQKELAAAELKKNLKGPAANQFAIALARKAKALLGPNPTPRQREKIAAELRELKKGIPDAAYKKHLCPLETGAPCP